MTSSSNPSLTRAVKPGDAVMIAAGFVVPDRMGVGLAESDGPLGAAVLAKALVEAWNVLPMMVCMEGLDTPVEAS